MKEFSPWAAGILREFITIITFIVKWGVEICKQTILIILCCHIADIIADIYSFNNNLVLQQVMLFIPTALSEQQHLLHVSHCHSLILHADGPNVSGNILWNPFVAFWSETILERGDLLRISDIWLRVPLSSLWGVLEDTEEWIISHEVILLNYIFV